MPLEKDDVPPWLAPPLRGRLSADASVEQVAEVIVELWISIDAALQPIIGHRGVAALYQRSLKLAEALHPWLGSEQAGLLERVDLAALQATLCRREATEAAAGGASQLQAFHSLLASLIGNSLTDSLLRSVWTSPAGNPPAQDTAS